MPDIYFFFSFWEQFLRTKNSCTVFTQKFQWPQSHPQEQEAPIRVCESWPLHVYWVTTSCASTPVSLAVVTLVFLNMMGPSFAQWASCGFVMLPHDDLASTRWAGMSQGQCPDHCVPPPGAGTRRPPVVWPELCSGQVVSARCLHSGLVLLCFTINYFGGHILKLFNYRSHPTFPHECQPIPHSLPR